MADSRNTTCNVSNPRADVSASEARRLFSYDADTGVVTWQGSKQKARNGSRAGYVHSLGHRYICFNGHNYKEHRVAWLIHFGQWPERQVDHINGDHADNRISNLRLATGTQNQANKGLQRNNTTGFKGVGYRPDRGFFAIIKKDRKSHYLGQFNTAEEAHAAYCAAAKRLFGEFARTA